MLAITTKFLNLLLLVTNWALELSLLLVCVCTFCLRWVRLTRVLISLTGASSLLLLCTAIKNDLRLAILSSNEGTSTTSAGKCTRRWKLARWLWPSDRQRSCLLRVRAIFTLFYLFGLFRYEYLLLLSYFIFVFLWLILNRLNWFSFILKLLLTLCRWTSILSAYVLV